MTDFLNEDLNFLGLPEPGCRPESAGVIVIPVPFEATSSFGQGSARGPEAILEASREVEFYDIVLGDEPCRLCRGIATLPPLEPGNDDGAAVAQRLYEAVTPWIAKDKFIVSIGGEHTSVIGAIDAHCETYDDVTVLQLDAHSDLRPAYEDDPWSHACAMARVLDFHDHIVQVGIRSQERQEAQRVLEYAIPHFNAHDIHHMEHDREDWIAQVIAATRPRVYITFDCDVFDPAIIPATGTPEPGGLTWRQIDELMARLCEEREVIGLDITELAPVPGFVASQATIAKLITRIIGYRFSQTA